MSEALSGFEGLLHEALSPIDPPEDLVLRLEGALTSLTESAVEELEAWELSAMLLRARHRPRPDASGLRGVRSAALRAVGDVGEHTRRLLG
jgi:hypothetical protein